MQGGSWQWTTKQGERLHIQDMDTSHILNCMKQLESVNFAIQRTIGGGYDCEDMWCEEVEHDYSEVYNNMVLELRIRAIEKNNIYWGKK